MSVDAVTSAFREVGVVTQIVSVVVVSFDVGTCRPCVCCRLVAVAGALVVVATCGTTRWHLVIVAVVIGQVATGPIKT